MSLMNRHDDSIFSEISEYAHELKRFTKILLFGDKIPYASIEDKTKDYVCIFPNIVSNTLPKDVVHMVSRALEVKNANLVKMVLSNTNMHELMWKLSQLDRDEEYGRELIKTIHNNLENDLDSLFGILENTGLVVNLKPEDIENISSFVESSLNDIYVTNGQFKVFTEIANVGESKLTDSDIDKLNNLAPMMIQYALPTHNTLPQGNSLKTELITVSLLFGVKTKCYGVSSNDIYEVFESSRTNSLINFIKMSTGETRFFKDFIFEIGKLKDEYEPKSGETKRIFNALRKRSQRRKGSLNSNMSNASIATLTLNITEVEEIKRKLKIDLLDNNHARKFMDKYSFINMCVVDEVDEVVHIISDSKDDKYTAFTFSYIDRVAKNEKIVNKPLKKTSGIF